MQIEGSTFIVTGGASGLGAATARMIVDGGGHAVIADLKDDEGRACASQLGDSARFVRTDVTDEASGKGAVAAALDAFGGVQGLVNCAGIVHVIVNTASVAAFDGQIGQAAYSASKAGVAGMTLPIARELARYGIRVMAIAPGIFETPMVAGLAADVQESLGRMVPFPPRLGKPAEFASLVRQIIENPMLNGEVIRLDGAIRMAPK